MSPLTINRLLNKYIHSLRRMKNAEAVQHAFDRRWISEWEKDFCFDIMRKHKLSPKRAAKKNEINLLVLARMKR